MYLKELTIFGFKSFGTKSKLTFVDKNKKSDITAIVGPNGSGKSNVADAVRWALGEQSSNLLRSKRSEDVIFFGNQKQGRSSYAEIALTLASDQEVTVEINGKKFSFSEIEIARKLYRSGDSEYLINRKKVRLLDIQQLMATIGFGQSSYSIIGQGMIDRLLFFNASERKNLFDEAAGIKQYQIKRDISGKKLSQTEDNLIRLKDLSKEIEPRVINLRRLVKRAQGKEAIEEELDELVSKLYGSIIYTLSRTVEDSAKEINTINNQIQKIKNEANTQIRVEGKMNDSERQKELEVKISQLSQKRDLLIRRISYLEAKKEQREAIQLNSYKKSDLESKLAEVTKTIDKTNELLRDGKQLSEKRAKIDQITKEAERLSVNLATCSQEINHLRQKQPNQKIDFKAKSLMDLVQQEMELNRKLVNLENQKQQEQIDYKRAQENKIYLEKKESELRSATDREKNDLQNITRLQSIIGKEKEERLQILKAISGEVSVLGNRLKSEIIKLSPNNLTNLDNKFKDYHDDNQTLLNSLEKSQTKEELILWREKAKERLQKIQEIINQAREIVWAANDQERQKLINLLESKRNDLLIIEGEIADITFRQKEKENESIRAIEMIKRFDDELATIVREKSKLALKNLPSNNQEKAEIEDRLASVREKITQVRSQKEAIDQEANKLLEEKIKEKELNNEKLASLSREKFTLDFEIKHLGMQIEEHNSTIDKLLTQKKVIEAELISLKKNSQDNDLANRELDNELEVGEATLAEIDSQMKTYKAELNKIIEQNKERQNQYFEKEKTRKILDEEAESLRTALSGLMIKQTEAKTKREDMFREAKLYTKKEIIALGVELDQNEQDLMRAKIENLRRKKESIGEVDRETQEEYQELEVRSTELNQQIGDLETAREDLLVITGELDAKIKNQFKKTFSTIAEKFNHYFSLLFDGGRANLNIVLDEDGKPGIEIEATPPGKKIQSLSNLSGGEKTLAALSLIFAILAVNPSPFCVLDEVDAALDESNTKRFIKILTSLSKKTQFLLISHNRDTMKSADTLYGITMDENHLSRIISLRLSEALKREE